MSKPAVLFVRYNAGKRKERDVLDGLLFGSRDISHKSDSRHVHKDTAFTSYRLSSVSLHFLLVVFTTSWVVTRRQLLELELEHVQAGLGV